MILNQDYNNGDRMMKGTDYRGYFSMGVIFRSRDGKRGTNQSHRHLNRFIDFGIADH